MLILPTTYMGPACYYRSLLSADNYAWEACESFPKQTLRNRCLIQGNVMLSIPVQKVEHKQLTRDIRISYQQKWQHQHWMALVSAYGKSPFWMYYEDFFRPFYERQWEYLIDYNWQMHEVLLSLLKGQMPTSATSSTTPQLTTDWQGMALEEQWGDSLSVIDLLCKKGNEAILLLTNNN